MLNVQNRVFTPKAAAAEAAGEDVEYVALSQDQYQRLQARESSWLANVGIAAVGTVAGAVAAVGVQSALQNAMRTPQMPEAPKRRLVASAAPAPALTPPPNPNPRPEDPFAAANWPGARAAFEAPRLPAAEDLLPFVPAQPGGPRQPRVRAIVAMGEGGPGLGGLGIGAPAMLAYDSANDGSMGPPYKPYEEGPQPIHGPPRPQSKEEKASENIAVAGVLTGSVTTGAAIGTAICPGAGTAVGAVIGAAAGVWLTWVIAENNENARRP